MPFASPNLDQDGIRGSRSYPADSTITTTWVTYHWPTPPGVADVGPRGHYDDPNVIAAAVEALDDPARAPRLPEASR